MLNSEGRRYARFDCEHPMWLRPSRGNEEYELAEVQNISTGGVYFLARGPLTVNEVVDISIEIPRKYEMVSLRGPVRHVHRTEDAYFCGLEFSELENMDEMDFNRTVYDIAHT